jgi:hypothetical protein
MSKNKKKHTNHHPKKNEKNSSALKKENEQHVIEQLKENTSEPEKKSINMEVYHPHGNHPNRKFKDYIFEFMMLFIAITGGFFMENMREHRVDRHKEKEYMVGLIRDVKEDTTAIKSIIRWNRIQIMGLDSLIVLLDKPVPTIKLDELITLISSYLNNYRGFAPRDITITQLKNSGGLRLIENNAVSDSIVNYYSTIEYYHELNVKMNYRFIEDTYKLELQFIDFSPDMQNKILNINDINKLKELKNRCCFLKPQINWDNVWLNNVYNQSINLLKYVKEEYKIKN